MRGKFGNKSAEYQIRKSRTACLLLAVAEALEHESLMMRRADEYAQRESPECFELEYSSLFVHDAITTWTNSDQKGVHDIAVPLRNHRERFL